jgi:hypothetical protein
MLEGYIMRGRGLFFLVPLVLGLALIASCKPINLFSPLVDPSKMGNDAKIEAGYNAIADGDYTEAVDFFSDVIDSASGDDLTAGYIGRATAYIHIGAPNLSEGMSDIMSGDTDIDSLGQFIKDIKGTNDYATFFASVQLAATDYNGAMANSGGITDSGILIEVYQTNMMAATGVGSTKIAFDDDTVAVGITDNEIDIILEGAIGGHTYNIDTWGDPGPPNGLDQYVNGTTEENKMLVYLQGAFDALTELESDPPLDMDIPSLKSNINEWVINGLGVPGGLS